MVRFAQLRFGAASCSLSFQQGWVRRLERTRAVIITVEGHQDYRELLGLRLSS